MTVTTKSDDGRVECFYDSIADKENFYLTVPSSSFGFITVKVPISDAENFAIITEKFSEYIKITTGR